MSNSINGYNVNPNLAISQQTYQRPTKQEVAVVPVAGNTTSYKGDGYSFDLSSVQAGKVPEAKIGFLDKLMGSSENVMNTPKNLQLFKDFQSNIFLKAGSGNSEGIMDLQRKLKFLGFNVNVNGNFGPATEKAILNFKESIGIDDGFLNKGGNPAVTPIVSKTTMSLINSKVAGKLNNPGQVEVPAVAKKDLDWAKDLKAKILDSQYKPSQAERKRYDEIYQKQQMIVSANNGSYQVGSLPGPTNSEVQWAKDFIIKVKQYGQKPSQEDTQKYNDIQNRQQMSKAMPKTALQGIAPQNQSASSQPVGNTVSDSQLNWAKQFEQKVNTQNYKPTQEEFKMYVEIYNKTNGTNITVASLQGASQPQNTGAVSPQEFQWAKNLEKSVSGGYKVKPEENTAYNSILSRWQQSGIQGQQPQAQPIQQGSVNPPSQQEITWALDLEKKVKQNNYTPNSQDVATYNDIATRLNQVVPPQQQEPAPTQTATKKKAPVQTQPVERQDSNQAPTAQELQWATQFSEAVKNNYQYSQEELAQYKDIFNRQQNSGGIAQQEEVSQPASNPLANQPTVKINAGSGDTDLNWALQLLDAVKQGYVPTEEENQKYEQVIARNQAGS